MEEILIKGMAKKKWKNIAVEVVVAERLEKLNKGSYNSALKHLLDINPEKKVFERIEDTEDRLDKI